VARRSQAKEDWQLTVYIPKELRKEDPIEKLRRLAKARRRSLNFLAVEALLSYLERERAH
jgi:predicted transcriptional regulator